MIFSLTKAILLHLLALKSFCKADSKLPHLTPVKKESEKYIRSFEHSHDENRNHHNARGLVKTENTWSQVGQDLYGETSELFGGSVSMSSDGNIIAANGNGGNGNGSYSGVVRIFQFDGAAWVQVGADIDGEAAGDILGVSLSISADGNIVALGGSANDGNGSNSGHTRVYQFDGSEWVQLGADIDGEAAGDVSGFSVSLSSDGNIVAVGAKDNDDNGSNSGHVRVYQFDGAAWVQVGADIDGDTADDNFGISVSLSSDGSIVAVGAYYNDGNDNLNGQVQIFEYDGTSWLQLGENIDGEAALDFSGRVSLSSNGKRIAIGATSNDGNGDSSGHTRVYEYDESAWVQLGADIDGEAALDFSGRVSLSSDGNTVAIGATGNDGNGGNSGHIRVYNFDGTVWSQLGEDLDGDAAGDLFGFSVSLSSDGTRVAVGGAQNGSNGFF